MPLPRRVSARSLDKALEELASSAKMRHLLARHYRLKDQIAPTDRLGALVGYRSGGPVHGQYGKLGTRLASRFAVKPEEGWPSGYSSELVIDFQEADASDSTHDWYWRLSAPIAGSLERLGWVKPKRLKRTPEQKSIGLPDPVLGDPFLDPEGRKKLKRIMTAERSPGNRRAVLLRHKSPYRCEACGMDFASRYGAEFGRVIEVHHQKALARGVQTPRPSDFLLLCPNCHVVAHYARALRPRPLRLLRKLVGSWRRSSRLSQMGRA